MAKVNREFPCQVYCVSRVNHAIAHLLAGPILSRSLRCIFYGDLYSDNECYDPRIGPKLELLTQARKNFAYGPTTDYFQYRDCIGFVRSGDAHHPGCAVVIRSSIGPGETMP